MKSKLAKWKPRVAGIVLLIIVVSVILPISVGWVLTHPPRKPISLAKMTSKNKFENVSFQSRYPGVNLKGWLFSSPNSTRTIIFAHGYAGNRLNLGPATFRLADKLIQSGFNVLMFDFRGCGESGGTYTTLGRLEKEDLKGAIDFVKHRNNSGKHIGVIGFSMGAATALMTAAEDKRIEAVVADSPFYDLKQYLMENMPVWTKLPNFPFTKVILRVLPVLLKINPESISPISVAGNIKVPVLLIHGTADKQIPATNSQAVYEALSIKKEFWVVEGSGHIGSIFNRPNDYENKVLKIFSALH